MKLICACTASLLLALGPCDATPDVGGGCDYDHTPGVATIISVETAGADDFNCPNDPVVVVFDFVPDDPADAALAKTGERLWIGDGKNPPRPWVEAEGLTVGSTHTCIRDDITAGTCTPLLFDFPNLDLQAASDACYDEPEPAGFTLSVVPQQMYDAINGQLCVLLVTVEDDADVTTTGPISITATANDATVTVEPAEIIPGEVCELTVIPAVTFPDGFEPSLDDISMPYGEGLKVEVSIAGRRAAVQESATISLNVLPGEDLVEEYATEMRDLFIPYLASEHPESGITADTVWTPTIVKPHILVVTHYLFFSDEWEMSVMWHVMIEPYNWATIYLRPRHTSTTPEYAFEISSVTAEPPIAPVAVDVPDEIDR